MKKLLLIMFLNTVVFSAESEKIGQQKQKEQKEQQGADRNIFQNGKNLAIKTFDLFKNTKNELLEFTRLPLGLALCLNARRKFNRDFIIACPTPSGIIYKELSSCQKLYTLTEFTIGSLLLKPYAKEFSTKMFYLLEKWASNKY